MFDEDTELVPELIFVEDADIPPPELIEEEEMNISFLDLDAEEGLLVSWSTLSGCIEWKWVLSVLAL